MSLFNPFNFNLGALFYGQHWGADKEVHGGTVGQSSLSTGPVFTRPTSVSDTIRDAPAFKNKGIRAGEIIGHRCWMLIEHPPAIRLGSMAVDFVWTPGNIEEFDPKICAGLPPGEPTVNEDSSCGFHAFKTVRKMRAEYDYKNCVYGNCVYGTVSMWGTVVEHKYGYRSEFAKIRSIEGFLYGILGITPQDAEKCLQHLQKLYTPQQEY